MLFQDVEYDVEDDLKPEQWLPQHHGQDRALPCEDGRKDGDLSVVQGQIFGLIRTEPEFCCEAGFAVAAFPVLLLVVLSFLSTEGGLA